MNVHSLKRGAAATSLVLAAAGLAFTMSAMPFANADLTGENTTGSAVGTVPQCAWHLDGVSGAVTLAHGDSAKYNGADYSISGSTSDVNTYVADSAAGTPSTDPAACSWYSGKKGAQVTVSTSATSPAFTSSSFEGDSSMNFSLDSSSHKLSAAVTPTCSSDDGWVNGASGTNDIYTGHLSGVPTSLANASTTTISSCSYTITYSTTVPSGMTPTHAGSNYAMTGPALTTTLTLVD